MDTIDEPPFSSLVSSFSQLEMNPNDGPINMLLNEVMQLIMAKLLLDDDVNKLIRLRLVSNRWNALVLDYCQLKKAIIVNYSHSRHSPVELASSAPMIVCPQSVAFFGQMFALFPNTEQLSISLVARLDNSDIPSLVIALKSLDSLKQLSLFGQVVLSISYMYQILPKLEHIEIDAFNGILSQDELRQFVSNLRLPCGRVFFGAIELDHTRILQWHNINAEWISSVTHLQMRISDGQNADFIRVLHFLGGHAASLTYLDITFSDNCVEITLAVIKDLAKLTRLTVLKLGRIEMDVAALKQAAAQHRLTALVSVVTCKLCLNDGPNTVNEEHFTRVILAIFPSLTDLQLEIGEDATAGQRFLRNIGRYLRRVPQLAKYEVELV